MSYHQLSQEERYTIAFFTQRGESKADIAKKLGRHISTIYREVDRNRTNHDGWYRAFIANSYAVARRRRERRRSRFTKEQWDRVIELLVQRYSPEQVAGIIRKEGWFSISHESIYQYIIRDRHHGGALYKELRTKTKKHRKRLAKHQRRTIYDDRRRIASRPEIVERRGRVGDWEGDTVYGADRHHSIVTLVERKTGYAIIKKVPSRTVAEVTKVICEAIEHHPWKFRTITFDNGFEFMGYKEIESRTRVRCYYANPYHSWERGTNENFNGLVRQYLPKGTCMRHITQEDCDWVAGELNSRPRKRYGYRTPKEMLYGH